MAPDLYAGTVIPYHDEAAADEMMKRLDFLAAADEIAGAAAGFFKAAGRKVGPTGFCLGRVVSILGAIRLGNIDAASAYYGAPSDDLSEASDIRVPVQAHFALRDTWCTPADADAWNADLQQAESRTGCSAMRPTTALPMKMPNSLIQQTLSSLGDAIRNSGRLT